MKKQIFISLSLLTVIGAFAQNSSPRVHINYAASTSANSDKEQGIRLREKLSKAQSAFRAAPDSKEAEDNFVKAQQALAAYQKSDAKVRIVGPLVLRGSEQQNITLHKTTVALDSARSAFDDDPESPAKRYAFISAQKAVFKVQENMAPLILVDGTPVPTLDGIENNRIKSIAVLKENESTLKQYGEKAKNGVIIVSTRPQEVMESLEQMRLNTISRAIGLKENQKQAFEDKYRAYNEQVEGLRNHSKELGKKVSGKEALEELLKNNITIEQKRLEMYKALGKILSDQQLTDLYKAELNFARTLIRSRTEEFRTQPHRGAPTKPQNTPNRQNVHRTNKN